MTDKKPTGDLNDFFKKASTKKQAPQKKKNNLDTPEDDPTKEVSTLSVEETKEAPKSKKQDVTYESSEEEKTDLTLGGDDKAKIKDRKEVEAERRKKQEQESGGVGIGWRALDTQAKEASEKKQLDAAAAKIENKGMVNFKGKPSFTRKAGIGNKSDFPELGSVSQEVDGTKEQQQQSVSKKDQPHMGDFGNTFTSKRLGEAGENREQHAQIEERKPASKPIFTNSKTKKTTVVTAVEVNEKQSYNFETSGMMVSTATDKTHKRTEGEQQDGEQRPKRDFGEGDRQHDRPYQERPKEDRPYQDRPYRDRPDRFEKKDQIEENDFETVTEKKRVIKPRPTGEINFGAKPSFSKGNFKE